MASDLDEIAAAIREHWSYLEDRSQHFGVDLDPLLASAKASLSEVQDADGFARVVRRFVAGLQDGHARAVVPGETPASNRWLPFRLVDCEEGLVVAAVEGELKSPRVGDQLLVIGGRPVAALVAEIELEILASTPGMRRALAVARLERSNQERVACTFSGTDGERCPSDQATLREAGSIPKPGQDNWSLTWPGPDVALLHLSSFTVPRWQEWLAAKPEERDPFLAEGRARIEDIIAELRSKAARGLIIDLRGNTGGTDLFGIHLAERLLESPFRYFLLSMRHEETWTTPGGMTYGLGDHERFLGPVVALIDARSFSTADNFLRCLQDVHPRFTAVGLPSGAGTGAPRQLVVARNTKTVVGACTMRVHGPKGQIIEGRGTLPDVPVRWTRADVLTGRDPDLAAALRTLGQ
jgi:C-terminal processing protease CtpA/Prc